VDLQGAFDIARDSAAYFAWIEKKRYSQTEPYEVWDVFEPHYGTVGGSQYVEPYEFADHPAISAGRQWLAYTSVGHHALHQVPYQYDHSALAIANLATNTRVTLLSDVEYQDPAFAPSGAWLAFAADFSSQLEIWKAHVAGDGTLNGLTQLTHGAAGLWSRASAWSSDGEWLIFERDGDPDPNTTATQLFIVRADGSSLRPVGIAGAAPAWYVGGSGPVLDERVYLPAVKR
jgi:hypothetical protein